MYEFDHLDENEIMQYPELHSAGGLGEQVSNLMRDYKGRLIDIKCNDFYADDMSTTKDAISELIYQMKIISEAMDDVDFMIDNLFHIVKESVLKEEDKIADRAEW